MRADAAIGSDNFCEKDALLTGSAQMIARDDANITPGRLRGCSWRQGRQQLRLPVEHLHTSSDFQN
jgi:hypothetical protein